MPAPRIALLCPPRRETHVRFWRSLDAPGRPPAPPGSDADPGRAKTFFLSDKLLATVAVHVDRIVRACFYCCDSVVSPGATSGQCWAIGTVTRRALQHTLLTPGSPPGAV